METRCMHRSSGIMNCFKKKNEYAKKHFLVCMGVGGFLCHSVESKTDLQTLTSSCIVVHMDSLQLQVTVAMVTASGVDAVLIAYHLPKLK